MYAVDYVKSRRIGFEALLHRPASSATKRAQSVHVPGRRVAKTVLVKVGRAFVLAVLPATARIDLDRLAAALDLNPEEVRLATLGEIARIFDDCEPGTIPPFGRLYGLRTVVDSGLSESESIVFPTNTRHLDLRMTCLDFDALEQPLRADFCRPITPRRPRPSGHRRRAS
jgi:Ala-tRNA(Pro) deacylase